MHLLDGGVVVAPDLSSSQEEADERIIFHLNHGYERGIRRAYVISPDTDVFICILSHQIRSWKKEFEIFVKMGARKTSKIFPTHEVWQFIENNILSVLPAVHALTGCDTTSSIGNKVAFLRKSVDITSIIDFGTVEFTEQIISGAERFLLDVLGKTDYETFDSLRYDQYYKSSKLDFSKLVCTSETLKNHIRRAFLQCNKWFLAHMPFESQNLNPLHYGYKDVNGKLLPLIISTKNRPEDLPEPCKCGKCATVKCSCRIYKIGCSKFCKCFTSSNCQNPFNS